MPYAPKTMRDPVSGEWIVKPKNKDIQAQMVQNSVTGGWSREIKNGAGMTKGEYKKLVQEWARLNRAWKVAVKAGQTGRVKAIETRIDELEYQIRYPETTPAPLSIEQLNESGDAWQPMYGLEN